jgi:hypothetical protein
MSALDCSLILEVVFGSGAGFFRPRPGSGAIASHELADQIVPASNAKLFGHDPQAGIRGDEVYGLNACFALDGEQQMPQKYGPAGSGGRDGQILRRTVWQR